MRGNRIDAQNPRLTFCRASVDFKREASHLYCRLNTLP